MKINLVMIVKDEQRCLKRCLRSVAALVDDMIIVDTGSRDDTKSIALAMGARVFDYVWRDDFSAARNYALDQSDGDWNLVLDADEYLRPGSREVLEEAIRLWGDGGKRAGTILRYDTYRDQGEFSVGAAVIPRLLPGGVRYSGSIHEQPKLWDICFQTPVEADHDGYLFSDKGERNLPYLEAAVTRYPEDSYYQYQMAVTLRNLKRQRESLPWFRKFYCNLASGGAYRADGIVLYLYTLMDMDDKQSLLEALAVVEKEESALQHRSDFCFVCGLFYMKLILWDVEHYVRYLPRIETCYLKCLEIGEHPEHGGVVGTGSFKAAYNLGLWYELSGHTERAKTCYRESAKTGYQPSIDRLKGLLSQ